MFLELPALYSEADFPTVGSVQVFSSSSRLMTSLSVSFREETVQHRNWQHTGPGGRTTGLEHDIDCTNSTCEGGRGHWLSVNSLFVLISFKIQEYKM